MITRKQERQILDFANTLGTRDLSENSAFVTLMRICRDYVNDYNYPLLKNEDRDRWLAERLQKFRIRYYDKI
jgi:hypothetical protein